jgi:hypothetical protein
MTPRCCWFTQPATATRTNRSGSMCPRVPEAGWVGCSHLNAAPPSKRPLGRGVDPVFGQYGFPWAAVTDISPATSRVTGVRRFGIAVPGILITAQDFFLGSLCRSRENGNDPPV